MQRKALTLSCLSEVMSPESRARLQHVVVATTEALVRACDQQSVDGAYGHSAIVEIALLVQSLVAQLASANLEL